MNNRKQSIRDHYARHELNGKIYSIVELSEIYGLKQNTISTRLKRGWTLKQSLGLVNHNTRRVTLNGKKYPYNGKLTYSEILTMRRMFEVENLSTIKMGEVLGIDPSQVWRLCDTFEFKRKDTSVDGPAERLEDRSGVLSLHPRWNP